jgi:Effector Associated Constant Component 1
MAGTYTIESADDGAPIDPKLLRELRDLLRNDEDLDLGVRLKDQPPAPGEQGAIPVAIEVLTAATPLGTAFVGVLMHWIHAHRLSIKVSRKGDDVEVELKGMSVQEAERLLEKLGITSGTEPDDGD